MFLKSSVTFLLFLFLKDSLTSDLKSNVVSFFKINTFSNTAYPTTGFYDRIVEVVESAPNSTELNSNLNFRNLTKDNLHQLLYPIGTFYISPSKLASLFCHKSVNYSHDENLNLFIKILEGAEQQKQSTELFDCLSKNESNPNFLNILAEQFFKTPRTFEQALNLSTIIPVLAFYTPPPFLLESEKINQTFLILYLNFLRHSFITNSIWNQLPLMNRKTLVHIILQNNILDKKSVLTNLPFVLQDLNLTSIEELKVFDYNISLINSVKWNILQARKLIDEKDEDDLLDQLPNEFLLYMLPRQLQQANQTILEEMMNNLKEDDYLSFPTAVQIFEYWVADIPKVLPSSEENNMKIMGKLLYTQNNIYLSRMYGKSLSLEECEKLNSPHYTFLQAYYILGEFKILNETDKLLNLKGLLAAIPTSAIIELFDHIIPEVYLTNLFSAPKGNKIRAAAIFELYKKYGFENYIELALRNEQNDFISISPLEIQTNASSILQFLQKDESESLKRRTATLPTYILTELLRKDGNITFEDIFNASHPIYLAILGLNCEILSRIPITDFMPIFEYYNKQRKLYNKKFPKYLQKCAQMSFLSYLHDKAVVQVGDHQNIIQFLDLVDIKSVGGYIMATLPVEQILLSQHHNDIIREIGSLSLPELMLAVPEDHLKTLVFQYLKKIDTTTISLKHLLILGNLTHYLREEALKKIEPLALKLMLETKMLDTRICASATTRKIWAELLELTFGPLEIWKEDTVLTVADMLITFEKRQLDKINSFVRLNVADLFKSNYLEEIPWRFENLPFYEVCVSTLSSNEHASYELAITNLTLFYAVSIENQLQSIWPPNKNFNSMRSSNLVEKTNSEWNSTNWSDSLSKEKSSKNSDYSIVDLITNSLVPPKEITSQISSFVSESNSEMSENVTLSSENENVKQSATTISDFTTFSEQLKKFNHNVSKSTYEVSEDIDTIETTGTSSILNSDVMITSKIASNSEISNSTLPFNDTKAELRVTTVSETSPTTLPSKDITTELKVITTLETLPTITSSKDITTKLKVITTSETSPTTPPSNDIKTELKVITTSETSPTTPPSNDIKTELKVTTTLETSSDATPLVKFTKLENTFNSEKSLTTLSNALPSSSWRSDLFTTTIDEGFTKKIRTLSTKTVTDAITNSTLEIQKENAKLTEDSTEAEILINKSSTVPKSTENVSNSETTQTMSSQFASTSVSSSSSSIAQVSTIGNYRIDTNGIGLTTKTIDLPAGLFNYTNNYLNTLPKTTIKSRDQRETKTKNNQIHIPIDEKQVLVNFIGEFYKDRQKRDADSFNSEIKLSCNTLKMLGSLSKFVIPLFNFTDEDYFNCIELLDQMKLSNATKKQIWSSVKDKIPVPNLAFVAENLLTEDVDSFNFNVKADWGLEILDILSKNQNIAEKLNEKFRRDNEDNINTLPIFTIVALREAVCQFSFDTLKELMHADEKFLNIWSLFYTLKSCPRDCLKIMAEVAMHFFGKPSNWTPTIFAQLGPVVAGLPDEKWESNFIYHLHTSAIKCLSINKIKKINHTIDVRKMSFKAVEMLHHVHGNLLSHSKILNLSSVRIVMENDYFIEKKKLMIENNKVEKMNSEGKCLKSSLIIFWSFIFIYFM